jgi:very-short-patch-repair endonuclease/uncharacterized protein YjeT (DUF2065 family)
VVHRSAVPRVPHQPRELLTGPFRGSLAVARGMLTPAQLHSRAWRRLFRDVYVHRDVALTHQLRAVGATLLVAGAVVTGASAAALWDVDLVEAKDDVELTLAPGAHPRRVAGIRVRRARVPPDEVCTRRSALVTSPAATAVRVAAALPQDDAVVAVDRLLATGRIDLASVQRLAAAQSGRDAARARRVCALADGRAESRQETRLRLLMRRGGLPAPVAQFVVRNGAVFVARVDFAWPELKLAVEYDGLWHAEAGQFARDRQRLNRLQAAGWRVIFVTAADLHHPEQLIARIAAALAR